LLNSYLQKTDLTDFVIIKRGHPGGIKQNQIWMKKQHREPRI